MATKTQAQATPEVEEPQAPSETIVQAAAAALDDRKSKLAFARQVLKSRATGTNDADFAEALVTARVELAYGEGASVERYGKEFQLSTSKVANYGTTLSQLQEAKAPITENTFGDWFKLTTSGGSAKTRKELISHLREEAREESQESKAHLIRVARETFLGEKESKGSASGGARNITIEGLGKYLEKLAAQEWDGIDRETIQGMLFDAASAISDGLPYVFVASEDAIEAELVAA